MKNLNFRTSDRPSICADESLERESLDSLAKGKYII
jgi:hypothetical protein